MVPKSSLGVINCILLYGHAYLHFLRILKIHLSFCDPAMQWHTQTGRYKNESGIPLSDPS